MILGKKSPKIIDIFSIVCIHNFLNHVLPARTGESSFIFLLNRNNDVSLVKCISILFAARLMDLLSICLIFIISCFSYFTVNSLNNQTQLISLSGSSVFLLFSFILLLYYIKEILLLLLKLFHRLIILFSDSTPFWLSWVDKKVREIVIHLSFVKKKKLLVSLNIVSLFIWLFNVSMFFVLMKGFGYYLSPVKIAIGSTGAALANILPINGFGSFGMLEAGWTLSFMFVGLDKSVAISTGFGIHVIALAYAAIFALFGYCSLLIISLRRKVLN